jgi:hypothetical protein|tara:strand:- start:448 stop:1017 length:570 start_codon:yes stop_codon:yes gene_type:complete
VIDDEDEVNVVVDSNHTTDKVRCVLEHFMKRINVYERPFDNFKVNSDFHIEKATGDYIFHIDADEMPQELLIKNLKSIIKNSSAEIIAVPRINIDPGYTQEFLDRCKYNINEFGWINWPDFQTRIFKKCDHIKWTDEMHAKLYGTNKVVAIKAEPKLAMWHIKSIEKEENRWKDGNIITSNDNLYDKLM